MSETLKEKPAQRLRIYINDSDRWRGQPLSTALLDLMHSRGLAGATLFRGLAGYGAHSVIHSNRLEALAMDLPEVVETVDSSEAISALLEAISAMVPGSLITVEDMRVVMLPDRHLNPFPADRSAAEVMTRQVVTLTPQMPVYRAWQEMLDHTLKAMPVVDADRHVLGILTDEDLLARAGIQQRLSVAVRMDRAEIDRQIKSLMESTLIVADVMSHPVVTALDSETLGVVTARMVKNSLKRLPVIDSDGCLVGMISRLDILRQVASSQTEIHPRQQKVPLGASVADVMISEIPTVTETDSLQQIIEKFAAADTNKVIVVDGSNRAVGLISDADVVTRVHPDKRVTILSALRRASRPPAGQETAADLMSAGVLTVSGECPIVVAVRKMLAESRKWMVVVDRDAHPIGLVDRQILLEALISPSLDLG